MPQRLAVSLTIWQAVVSKKVANTLRVMGMWTEYNSGLRIESQIANSILQRTLEKYNTYLRPEVIHGRYIFFSCWNFDYAELRYTPDDNPRKSGLKRFGATISLSGVGKGGRLFFQQIIFFSWC